MVDGAKVFESYPVHMRQCMDAVLAGHPELRSEVKRYDFHPPNKRLLEHFLEHGRVRLGGGDLVLIAAVGANVHDGAQLVRL